MNRDLLHALSAVAADFYDDALERYPALHGPDEPDDEAMLIWRVLVGLDEVFVAIATATTFDDDCRAPPPPDPQQDLPF
jgi:hypothetical protein